MADTGYEAICFLRAQAIVAATDAGSRIYIGQAPQSAAYPHVIMSIVSRSESPTQDNGSAVDTFRIQVDCYAKSGGGSGFEIASTLSDALRYQWSRNSDPDTYSHAIDSVQEVNYLTDYMPDIDLFRVTNDYMVRVQPQGSIMTSLRSGTYTPTVSASVNMDTTPVCSIAQYMRVGNTVTVSGVFTADTTAGVASSFEMTLPIASAIAQVYQLAGTATIATNTGAQTTASIYASVANDTAKVYWYSNILTSGDWTYTFTYQII